jgi:fructose-1-phosphate kinase PfkB-like protein
MAVKPTLLAVCLNPTLQRTVVLPRLRLGAVNRAASQRTDASGKGINVARVFVQLGGRGIQLTQAGGARRTLFLDLAVADGVEVAWEESGAEIRTCTTLLCQETHVATEIVEEADPVAPATGGLLLARFRQLLPAVDMVSISGSKAAGLPPGILGGMAKLAAAAGKPLLLDIRNADLRQGLPCPGAWLKINRDELRETFGQEDDEPLLRRLFAEHGLKSVITDGPRDSFGFDGQRFFRQPVQPVVAVNPIGCGDSFLAGFAFGLATGQPLGQGLDLALDCARRNALCLRPGTITE